MAASVPSFGPVPRARVGASVTFQKLRARLTAVCTALEDLRQDSITLGQAATTLRAEAAAARAARRSLA